MVYILCVHVSLTIGIFPHILVHVPIREYVILYTCLSFISQDGDSALMRFATRGETEAVEAVVELVKAGANLDLQDKVHCYYILMQREFNNNHMTNVYDYPTH